MHKSPFKPIRASLASVVLIVSVALANGADVSLDTGDALSLGLDAERGMDPRAALVHFRTALEAKPDDAFLEQKVAQQLSDAAFLEADAAERIRLAKEAMVHAQRAVELDRKSAVARLSLSVLYGKLSIEEGIDTRIDYARRIHQHATEALELDPNYAWASHVLGRWHVELSDVNMAQRAVVSLFFGGLPKASLDQGIRLLETAVRLEPDAIPHRVELGFAYQRAGRTEEARACWQEAVRLPSVRVFDEPAKRRGREALAGRS